MMISIKKMKEFALKPRRLANTFWLWGVLYPFLLLSIISLIYVIYPFLSHWLQFIVISSFQVLLLIEVFFSLFLTYRVFDSKKRALSTCSVQLLFQIIILLVFVIIGGMIMKFSASDYIENTSIQNEAAPSFFSETAKLDYPNDAKLINISYFKYFPSGSVNIIFSVTDIDSFINKASKQYKFENLVMDYPYIEEKRVITSTSSTTFGNFLAGPFCMEGVNSIEVKPTGYFLITKVVAEVENFCGKREVLFTQIVESRHQPIIMVILPKERLVWLNHSFWF